MVDIAQHGDGTLHLSYRVSRWPLRLWVHKRRSAHQAEDQKTLKARVDQASNAQLFRLQRLKAQGYLTVLQTLVQRHGAPLALYSDRHGIFTRPTRKVTTATPEQIQERSDERALALARCPGSVREAARACEHSADAPGKSAGVRGQLKMEPVNASREQRPRHRSIADHEPADPETPCLCRRLFLAARALAGEHAFIAAAENRRVGGRSCQPIKCLSVATTTPRRPSRC